MDAVKIETERYRMIVIAEFGPRIAFWGAPGGANLLYWDKGAVSNGEWVLHGGHRVWITRPMADESPDAYLADNMPCDVDIRENRVRVESPPHPAYHIARGMEIMMLSGNTASVRNYIVNKGAMLFSGGVWSPTCVKPDDAVITIELGQDNVSWDIVKIAIPRIFAGNTVLLNDPQVTFSETQMIVKPAGIVTKRCVCAPKGIISMKDMKSGLRFTKTSVYQPGARYPMDGCNVAVFVGADNWMAEMETFGVEQPVPPGNRIDNAEVWTLSAES
jgi:hypothetical protein